MKPKKLPFEEFKRIYQKVPRLCVDLIIINSSEEVLLLKRGIKPYRGYWHIPGGTILFNESVKETIQRVAKEETNLTVSIDKLLGYIEYPIKEPIGQTITLAFLVHPKLGNLSGGNQGKELRYFNKIPQRLIKEQANFLKENDLMD